MSPEQVQQLLTFIVREQKAFAFDTAKLETAICTAHIKAGLPAESTSLFSLTSKITADDQVHEVRCADLSADGDRTDQAKQFYAVQPAAPIDRLEQAAVVVAETRALEESECIGADNQSAT